MRRAAAIAFRVAVAAVGAAPALTLARLRHDVDGFDAALGAAIARLAERLGPVAVKLAQMASYRRDLLPEALLRPLERLQDGVRPPRPAEIRAAIAAAWGPGASRIFTTIDETPVACGSMAAVCRATLRDGGAEVALKLLRPDAARSVERDIACLRRLVGIAARRPALRGIPLPGMFDVLAAATLAQCDLATEARHSEQLRLSLRPTGVIVPPMRLELCRPGALVQEYEHGLRRLTDPCVPEAAHRAAARRLLGGVYTMIFRDGLVHVDLHPGNVFVDPDGRVVLLDAGLVARLTRDDLLRFREFFLGLVEADPTACVRAMIASAAARPAHLDRAALIRDVEQVVTTYHGRRAGDFLVAGLVHRVFEVQRRHGLHGTPGFAGALWALVMFEGLVRDRFPDLDFQAEARPFFTHHLIEAARASMTG